MTTHSATRYLITGGASGLGKALALRLAKHHKQQNSSLRICIADMHDERANATVEQLTSLGVEAFYQHCDITQAASVEALQQAISTQWQGVDIVINNAGVATGGSLKSESIEQWQWVLDVNLLGMVRISQAFVDDFKAQGHGYFVNVSSQAGITPIPMMSSYNAVKAAVVGLSETMKLELAQYNIDVSVVCPSFFKTNLDESLRTSEPATQKLVTKLFERAPIDANQVADRIIAQMQQRKYLILTHEEGKKAFLLKKLLPSEWYLNMVIKQTKAMVSKLQTKAKQAATNAITQSEGAE